MSDVNLPGKTPGDSATEQVQLLNMSSLNGYNRLFGGAVMSWMDIVAGVTARRHSGCNVTTARVDGIEFLHPAYSNDVIIVKGHVSSVGRTSMMVHVQVYVEKLGCELKLTNSAWFTMVALDENEKPTPVPPLLLNTDEEREEEELAQAIRAAALEHRKLHG